MRWWWLFGMLLLVVACEESTPLSPTSNSPRLIEEATLPPPTVTPLSLPSQTPIQQDNATVIATLPDTQGESALLRTATPPNSPTATQTDTPTASPSPTITRTFTPSRTPTPSDTFTPTNTLVPSITPLATHTPIVSGTQCIHQWFFARSPPNCPQTEPLSTVAAFQTMESGQMIWLENGRTILVMYKSAGFPAWQAVPDQFIDGEILSPLGETPPIGRIEPQRGFGKFWQQDERARQRLGWGTNPEIGYAAFVQIDARTGTQYVSGANGEVYALDPAGDRWEQLR